jgi:indolepyruvate ferredoxin oxidoreductase beta subunit
VSHSEHVNIFLTGVGGQGIGTLSEVLVRSCLDAGHNVKSVDTHGLAQRGGIVTSHLKIGPRLFTPRIVAGDADMVIGLELLEAYRGAVNMLKPGGTVVYYDTEYQPIHVRMGRGEYPTHTQFAEVVAAKNGRLIRVYIDDLPDPRMQNIALLGRVSRLGLIPGVTPDIVEANVIAVVPKAKLEENLSVFHRAAAEETGHPFDHSQQPDSLRKVEGPSDEVTAREVLPSAPADGEDLRPDTSLDEQERPHGVPT